MSNHKYYLVSYYARLKGGGFGFARDYMSVNPNHEFIAYEFELLKANESGLTVNDVSIITRTEVSVEEYNANQQHAEALKEQQLELLKEQSAQL